MVKQLQVFVYMKTEGSWDDDNIYARDMSQKYIL
jgi:hypothetical protein